MELSFKFNRSNYSLKKNVLKIKNPQQLNYQLNADFYCDLDWIQTSNLLGRNQVRYSVAPRGR